MNIMIYTPNLFQIQVTLKMTVNLGVEQLLGLMARFFQSVLTHFLSSSDESYSEKKLVNYQPDDWGRHTSPIQTALRSFLLRYWHRNAKEYSPASIQAKKAKLSLYLIN
jgi:hypothetical protein